MRGLTFEDFLKKIARADDGVDCVTSSSEWQLPLSDAHFTLFGFSQLGNAFNSSFTCFCPHPSHLFSCVAVSMHPTHLPLYLKLRASLRHVQHNFSFFLWDSRLKRTFLLIGLPARPSVRMWRGSEMEIDARPSPSSPSVSLSSEKRALFREVETERIFKGNLNVAGAWGRLRKLKWLVSMSTFDYWTNIRSARVAPAFHATHRPSNPSKGLRRMNFSLPEVCFAMPSSMLRWCSLLRMSRPSTRSHPSGVLSRSLCECSGWKSGCRYAENKQQKIRRVLKTKNGSRRRG